MAYSEKVMDHFANPRNVGEIKDASGIGEVGNPRCGDIMRMYIKVDGDTITDVKFKTFGCGAAIATSSMATELIKGKRIEDALKLTNKAVMEALDGLPPVKVHCSVLAEQAIKAAVSDYYKRQGIDPTPFVGNIPKCESCACPTGTTETASSSN
jgi:nitrogen fixation NifU-like protein